MKEIYVKCVTCHAHYTLGNLHTCDPFMKKLVNYKDKKTKKQVK